MTKFEIGITLVIDADEVDPDSIPAYGNRYVDFAHDGDKWDITLTNTVEAETAGDAAATIDNDMRRDFSSIDPNWHGLIFHDDNEVLELDARDLNKEFKCRECGTKYVESFCSTDNVAICRWCSGEETEAGILE